jgi:hypothetical protein
VACPNGSSPQSGAPSFFTFDDSYIAGKFGTFAGWLTAWAMDLPASPQATSDFCSVDPPTELPSTADWLALASPPIALATGAYRRFGNQIKADKWQDLCQCNAPSSPSCGSPNTFANDVIVVGTSVALVTAWRVPTTATGASLAFTPHNVSSGSGFKVFLNSASSATQTGTPSLGSLDKPSGGSGTLTVSFTANSFAWLQFWIVSDAGTWNGQMDWTETFTGCTTSAPIPYTAPPNPSTPTGFPSAPTLSCSTTQDICNAIQTLNSKMDWLRSQVDLIQRQDVPFAYNKGTSWSASGSGTHPVLGILGLLVSVTSVPPGVSSYPDNPASYFDLGWVSFGTSDGYERSVPIRRVSDLFLGVSGAITSVAWSLPAGESATMTPLLREA